MTLAVSFAAQTTPAHAQPVISRDPTDISVTIYRDPNRREGAMDANWPGGYALISETRTVTIPAGDSVIRFEGVSEGMLPETAIVTGLPRGVREKNRDARLISPAGLVDAYLKRRVYLTRTNRATGKRTEQAAIIQAGPNGGVVITSKEGTEALGCAGLPERMTYHGVPADLSPTPTLSVLTTSDRAVTAKVTLTYMAQGFDWSANYVATSGDAQGKLALFAWLTVANGGAQSFKDARLQVVAGQPNKEANAPRLSQPEPALRLQCWPLDITSTHPRYVFSRLPWDIAQYRRRGESDAYETADIMVTGSRAMAPQSVAPPPPPPAPIVARQEDLGDLKLYRVPVRVTVAAQSQKQVAMIDQPAADYVRIYRATVNTEAQPSPAPMPFLLRGKNVKDAGLGLPLPAGGVSLFQRVGTATLLVGSDSLADKAIGEDVEINVGQSPDVQWSLNRVSETNRRQGWQVDISNARPFPIRAEIIVPYDFAVKPPGLTRGIGGWKLPIDVPANDRASVRYVLKMDVERP